MNLENVVYIGALLDRYGNLLAERSLRCMQRYFHEDWTLAEIASEEGISRQAVHDHLHRGAEQLERYESELAMVADAARREQLSTELLAAMDADERMRYESQIRALAE